MTPETNTQPHNTNHGSIKYPNDLTLQRRARGLNKKQAASLVGRSVRSIRRYESGRVLPPLLTALKLEILYRTQLGSLYDGLYQQLTRELRGKEEALRAGLGQKGAE